MVTSEENKRIIFNHLNVHYELSSEQLDAYDFSFDLSKELIVLETPFVIRREGQSIVLRWEVILNESSEVESLKVIDLGENKSNLFELSPMIANDEYELVKLTVVEVINKSEFPFLEPISDFDYLLRLFLVEIILQKNGTRVILRNKATCAKEIDFYYSNEKNQEVTVNLSNYVSD